mmetsp:Transcript_59702/g.142048  ORF Transcript_59702/g.142048 Transcript_59702/m.142048 type:complete len:527 (-) Transcript_59702:127-1707(-)
MEPELECPHPDQARVAYLNLAGLSLAAPWDCSQHPHSQCYAPCLSTGKAAIRCTNGLWQLVTSCPLLPVAAEVLGERRLTEEDDDEDSGVWPFIVMVGLVVGLCFVGCSLGTILAICYRAVDNDIISRQAYAEEDAKQQEQEQRHAAELRRLRHEQQRLRAKLAAPPKPPKPHELAPPPPAEETLPRLPCTVEESGTSPGRNAVLRIPDEPPPLPPEAEISTAWRRAPPPIFAVHTAQQTQGQQQVAAQQRPGSGAGSSGGRQSSAASSRTASPASLRSTASAPAATGNVRHVGDLPRGWSRWARGQSRSALRRGIPPRSCFVAEATAAPGTSLLQSGQSGKGAPCLLDVAWEHVAKIKADEEKRRILAKGMKLMKTMSQKVAAENENESDENEDEPSPQVMHRRSSEPSLSKDVRTEEALASRSKRHSRRHATLPARPSGNPNDYLQPRKELAPKNGGCAAFESLGGLGSVPRGTAKPSLRPRTPVETIPEETASDTESSPDRPVVHTWRPKWEEPEAPPPLPPV